MLNRNPNANKFVAPAGYKSLGWQVDPNHDTLIKCQQAGHERRGFNNSTYRDRSDDVITICDECQYYYHTDSTD